MKMKKVILASLWAMSLPAFAAVTADQAKQLGTTLTDFGAIKAGNKDGTIPEYTGGLKTAPAGFKPGSSIWPDPYKDEKPVLRIDAKNMDQYADKLSEGQKTLLKKFADYYIDVYPTHRTFAVPDVVLKADIRNATTCKLSDDHYVLPENCRGGSPFPIPQNGNEVMWNSLVRYIGHGGFSTEHGKSWIVDANGHPTMTSDQFTMMEKPYYQTDLADRDKQVYWRTYAVTNAPALQAGSAQVLVDSLDTDAHPRRAWLYTTGQRRVKLAPEFVYDTPVGTLGGVTLYDELFVFSGKQDRFDFKLVGKKEMYIPYNSYKFNFGCKDEAQFAGHHMNPACERWELHRVWVVESTLKAGMRHAYSKRTYYLDEDGYGAAMFDAFDQSGELHRAMFNSAFQAYDEDTQLALKSVTYDFNRGMYAVVGDAAVDGFKMIKKSPAEKDMSAEAIIARETTR